MHPHELDGFESENEAKTASMNGFGCDYCLASTHLDEPDNPCPLRTVAQPVIGRMYRPIAGSELRAARDRLGLSQVDLADVLDVSRVTVILWEGGRSAPRAKEHLYALNVLLALARILEDRESVAVRAIRIVAERLAVGKGY